jgi:predicted nuclease of predicted toxin-antitoxin system/uncharacterized protein (DUF433 family)
MSYQERIVLDPEIRFGKPTVRGTRITVADILSYLAGGMSEEQILADFPQLAAEDIRACLAFAAERERRLASSSSPWWVRKAQELSVVKLLFDENLAARLANDLADAYPDSTHVLSLGLGGTSDRTIWDHAGAENFILVTKDEDFHRLSVLLGPPPKVVWIRLGNCATADVERLLRLRREEVRAFAEQTEVAFLALGWYRERNVPPNNTMQPTTESVTPFACAKAAPLSVAADRERSARVLVHRRSWSWSSTKL